MPKRAGNRPTGPRGAGVGKKRTTRAGGPKGKKIGPPSGKTQGKHKPTAGKQKPKFKRSSPPPNETQGDAPDGERLQKVLAAAGVASRRECEALIAEGRVQVDGQVASELGVRVDPLRQTIHVDGEELRRPKRVYFAVNKPTGVVCTARDPSGRERVTDLLPPDVGRVFNVGRLDMASEGLILVTNDGELANRLTHPRHGVEKRYLVQVAGSPTPEALAEVRRGVYLDEGRVAFSNVRVKSKRKGSTMLEVTLDEGRNREIRRVLARVGHKVQKLQRVAVGPVKLGEMPPGAYRPLTRDEVNALREASSGQPAKAKKPKRAAEKRPPKRAPAKKKPPGRRVIGDE
ncbi:pseudouridine synthase [Botrimarina sp.]|uniref:pseudouridine synthase n=1 Tax=Botrimarina sp. TaxID=2795802 RepID=UPI0032EEB778